MRGIELFANLLNLNVCNGTAHVGGKLTLKGLKTDFCGTYWTIFKLVL